MPVQLAAVTFDCADALTVGRFWSAGLARELDPNASAGFASIGLAGGHKDGGTNAWLFAKVPESRRGPAAHAG